MARGKKTSNDEYAQRCEKQLKRLSDSAQEHARRGDTRRYNQVHDEINDVIELRDSYRR